MLALVLLLFPPSLSFIVGKCRFQRLSRINPFHLRKFCCLLLDTDQSVLYNDMFSYYIYLFDTS